MINVIFSLVFLFFFFITPLTAQDEEKLDNTPPNNAEEEIWSLEEDYISYFVEANHKAILNLWHDHFLGWPDSELHPAGKERGVNFLEEKYPTPSQVILKIKREGFRIVGDIAITHYLLISSWIDEYDVEQKSESRLTHTWIKEDSKWKILGGMSNNK